MKVKRLYGWAMAALLVLLNIVFLIGIKGALGYCADVKGATVKAVLIYEDGSTAEYEDAEKAWSDASGKTGITFKLMEDWKRKNRLKVTKSYTGITLDLNGRSLTRTNANHDDDGEVIFVEKGTVLNIIDSDPNYTTSLREMAKNPTGGLITGGSSSDGAGGIHLKSGSTVNMTGGTIYCCNTDKDGGAFYVDEAKLNVKDAAIIACCTEKSSDDCDGGAIYTRDSSKIKLENVTFSSNASEDNGGVIFCNDSDITIDGCKFEKNKCKDNGGVIYHKGGKIVIRNCWFNRNNAEDDGGVIYINKPRIEIYDSKFTYNGAGKSGGAIFVNDHQLYLVDSVVEGNNCGSYGGGIYVDDDFEVNLQGLVKVEDNTQKNAKENGDITVQHNGSDIGDVFIGHLDSGSRVGLNITGSLSSGGNKVAKGITSEFTNDMFFANRGKIKLKKSGTKTEIFMATVVTKYNYGPYIAIVLELIGAVFVIVWAVKKKNNMEVQSDGKEGEA